MDIKIDQEFKSEIPELWPEEREQLEKNILASGCRDPLVVWSTDHILLDGHNRYEICRQHDIEFSVVEIDLSNRNAALDWIDGNQLGRRNLTPDAFRLLLGRRYNRAKKRRGAPTGNQNRAIQLAQNGPIESTAQSLASEYAVSKNTVRRAGKFAEQVDKSPELQEAIRKRNPIKNSGGNYKAQGSGENEWYTPPEIIESVKSVLGVIDLDPASSAEANKTVGAK